ncbi:MAG: polysaccharide pyruvyl transferase family protein, partial [Acidimicrobiia bacterium]|nr:polysaccharide pyruvyl transferase family protein [Acidimicrobiia bacterium]
MSALMRSVVAAAARLDAASGPIELTVFDNGRGIRRAALSRASGPPFDYALMGARHSRRLHQRETLVTAVAAGRLTRRGGFGWTAHHPLVSRVRAADAVLDLSGGDSFTDLYGAQRFRQIVLHKRLTLDLRRPLVLLPQTYGPFRDERNRRVAVDLVRRAHTAWARDEQSFEALRDLLGDDLDPRRHRVGTDVAFGLEPRRPDDPPEGRLRSWLEDRPAPLVGINVSGLIWHDSRRHYGLRLDYRQLMSTLVRRLVDETDAVVALVPHVIAPHGHPQSDRAAAEELLASLDRAKAARVIVAPNPVGPAEAKWLIGQMDWFCGTRMHATIAALS